MTAQTGGAPVIDEARKALLLKLFWDHSRAEAEGDVDAVMATLAPEPLFEFYPAGYRVTSFESVRAFYSRVLPVLRGRMRAGPGSAGFGVGHGNYHEDLMWFSSNSLIVREDLFFTDRHGVERNLVHMALFTLKGSLLEGERMWTTAAQIDLFDEVLGPGFANLPGVSRII